MSDDERIVEVTVEAAYIDQVIGGQPARVVTIDLAPLGLGRDWRHYGISTAQGGGLTVQLIPGPVDPVLLQVIAWLPVCAKCGRADDLERLASPDDEPTDPTWWSCPECGGLAYELTGFTYDELAAGRGEDGIGPDQTDQ